MTISKTALVSAAIELADHKASEGIPTMQHDNLATVMGALQSALAGVCLHPTLEATPALGWAVIVDAQRAADFLSKAEALEASPVPSPFQASEYRAAADRALIEAASWLF